MALNTSELLNQAEALSMKDILDGLPEDVRANPLVLERLKAELGTEAASIYKNFFWEDNPDDRGRRRSMLDDELLPLVIGIYLQQGGINPENEMAFWQKLFHGK